MFFFYQVLRLLGKPCSVKVLVPFCWTMLLALAMRHSLLAAHISQITTVATVKMLASSVVDHSVQMVTLDSLEEHQI